MDPNMDCFDRVDQQISFLFALNNYRQLRTFFESCRGMSRPRSRSRAAKCALAKKMHFGRGRTGMRVGQKNKLTYRWARKGSRPRTGSRTVSSNPSTTSSTTAATPGTRLSISPGKSCPSPTANGQPWASHCEGWYYTRTILAFLLGLLASRSSSAFASFRSCVSKPSVNQAWMGLRRLSASSRLP
jgi:hypothetical protein